MGPPGVGKSHLAVALGVRAIKNGFSTTHFLLVDLMHLLKGDAAVSPRRLKAKRYLNGALLVIDEVGFRPLDRQEANLFFRLVSARYEKGSIILTSNKHVRDRPEIFAGDEILTTAILDRRDLCRGHGSQTSTSAGSGIWSACSARRRWARSLDQAVYAIRSHANANLPAESKIAELTARRRQTASSSSPSC